MGQLEPDVGTAAAQDLAAQRQAPGSTLSPPELKCYADTRPLLVIELDGPAYPDRFELLGDFLTPSDGAKPAKQCVPLSPGDLDDLSRDVDLYSVEPARSPTCRR